MEIDFSATWSYLQSIMIRNCKVIKSINASSKNSISKKKKSDCDRLVMRLEGTSKTEGDTLFDLVLWPRTSLKDKKKKRERRYSTNFNSSHSANWVLLRSKPQPQNDGSSKNDVGCQGLLTLILNAVCQVWGWGVKFWWITIVFASRHVNSGIWGRGGAIKCPKPNSGECRVAKWNYIRGKARPVVAMLIIMDAEATAEHQISFLESLMTGLARLLRQDPQLFGFLFSSRSRLITTR